MRPGSCDVLTAWSKKTRRRVRPTTTSGFRVMLSLKVNTKKMTRHDDDDDGDDDPDPQLQVGGIEPGTSSYHATSLARQFFQSRPPYVHRTLHVRAHYDYLPRVIPPQFREVETLCDS